MLDVQRMRRDIDYAQCAVALALHGSPPLHHCAELVDGWIRAARARDDDDDGPQQPHH
jgi:hypothetical protein